MSELKPCPFQKPGETHDVRFIELKPGYGQIGCADCGFWFPSEEMISRKNAIERWNTRAERTCGEPRGFIPHDQDNFGHPSFTELWCEHCDIELDPEWDYCPYCGAKVVKS